jgi:hypothetical protein
MELDSDKTMAARERSIAGLFSAWTGALETLMSNHPTMMRSMFPRSCAKMSINVPSSNRVDEKNAFPDRVRESLLHMQRAIKPLFCWL